MEGIRSLVEKYRHTGVKAIENPNTAVIGSGYQYFGSGGYWHYYKILYPKNKRLEEVAEIIEVKREDNGFVRKTWYTIRPKVKPLLIYHESGDCVGNINNPIRYFHIELFVWF